MIVNPNFTHRVVEILKEKLWDGDIAGIHKFMEEGFGITNDKLNAKILSGAYVMIFNEDGSGNIEPREDVPEDAIETMGGLPDLMTTNDIREAIRFRVSGSTGLLERQKTIILNFRDIVFNMHKVHSVELDSSVLGSNVARLLNTMQSEASVTTDLTTQEIVSIYNMAKHDDASKELIHSMRASGGSVGRLILIMDEVNRLSTEQANLIKAIEYIEKYIFSDVRHIDEYKPDGTKSTRDEQMEDISRYFWMTDFYSRSSEIDEYYQFLAADTGYQDVISKQVMNNEAIARTAVHSMSDTNHEAPKPKKYDTGDPMIDAYLESAMSEHPTSPVRPNDGRWDAGWISPEGAFWADKGTKANFIHLNLAQEIQKYYGGTYEWLDKAENVDHELEKHGWLKFHGNEVSFIGYSDMSPDNLSHCRITMKQVDKLYDYAKHMGYTEFFTSITNKRIAVSEMFEYTQEEWQDFFEW